MKISEKLAQIQKLLNSFNKDHNTDYYFQIRSESEHLQICVMKKDFGRDEEVMDLPSHYFFAENTALYLGIFLKDLEEALLHSKKEIEEGPPQIQKVIHNGFEYTYRLDS